MKLVKCRKLDEKKKVYDITTEKTNHYILSNGIISHNSGGGGLKYAASTIVYLSKKKDKDGKDVIGNIIRCKMKKSRFAKENKVIELKLSYDTGLDRYYGLLELAESADYIKRSGNRYEFPNGDKAFKKQIYADPEKYFTREVLGGIDKIAQNEFMYGSSLVEDMEKIEKNGE